MSLFLQIHSLTFHGPSNINRDDTGRPKTAMIGGVERLRISSQAKKRAIRTSAQFEEAMQGHLSRRTQRLGEDILAALAERGVDADKALEAARAVAGLFGKIKPEKKLAKAGKKGDAADEPKKDKNDEAWIEQLAFISPTERSRAVDLALRIAQGESLDPKRDMALLKVDTAVDIAMFGRMLADAAEFNREAAVQVAHAFTTHAAIVESDFYTAMDDDKPASEDVGAGFIGQTGFGSGVYYDYVCINMDLLVDNLGGDADLAQRAVAAFMQAFATVTPTGKINSFANHGRPSYILVEKGDQAPRTLAGAFLRPVRGEDLMAESITALKAQRERMDKAYGPAASGETEMNVQSGAGSLAQVIDFLREARHA